MERLFELIDLANLDKNQCINVIIDGTTKSALGLFNSYGEQIYIRHEKLKNPIFEGTYYFGNNFNAFSECLQLLSLFKDKRINIFHKKIPKLSENELVDYLIILLLMTSNSKIYKIHKISDLFKVSNLFVFFNKDINELDEKILKKVLLYFTENYTI